MNVTNRWLLPEGVEELLPPRAMQLERLCRGMIDLVTTWGYDFVIPPMIEYLESLLTGTGEDLDLQTFKLTDQLSGRLMGLRADITPQVARIDAHLLKQDTPTRLCYLGSVLHARPSMSGETRSPLQLGAELYGHAGVASDLEIVSLMLAALKEAGIQNIHLDIGHGGVFRALNEGASFDEEQQSRIFDALQRKAKDDLKQLFGEWGVTDKNSQALMALVDLYGDKSVLSEARKCLKNVSADTTRYIDELSALVEALEERTDTPVNIDLAELRGYHYHTGMVYTAFTAGAAEGIAFGGRYDDIGRAFGRARPATGFSTDVKSLLKLQAGSAQAASRIFAPAAGDPALEKKINALREGGDIVIRELAGQTASAGDMGCDRQLVLEKKEWVIKDL